MRRGQNGSASLRSYFCQAIDESFDFRLSQEDRFESRLAAAVNELVGDPGRARKLGLAGRRRAVEEFGWDAVAERTVELYRSLVTG